MRWVILDGGWSWLSFYVAVLCTQGTPPPLGEGVFSSFVIHFWLWLSWPLVKKRKKGEKKGGKKYRNGTHFVRMFLQCETGDTAKHSEANDLHDASLHGKFKENRVLVSDHRSTFSSHTVISPCHGSPRSMRFKCCTYFIFLCDK